MKKIAVSIYEETDGWALSMSTRTYKKLTLDEKRMVIIVLQKLVKGLMEDPDIHVKRKK